MVWRGQRWGLLAVGALVVVLLVAGGGVLQPSMQPLDPAAERRTVQLQCVRNPALCATHAPPPAAGVGGLLPRLASQGQGTAQPAAEREHRGEDSGSAAAAATPGGRIPVSPDLPPDPWDPPGEPSWFAPRRARCPERFLSVNTHTWGRHHNQLQSTILALLAAQLLNRTFILGHFRHNHKWSDVREYYSFALLQRHFCMVDFPTAVRLLRGEKQVECFGQAIDDMPLGKQLRVKCRNGFGPVERFFDQHQFRKVVADAMPHLLASKARIINLSGQLAFFLRPGLRVMAQGFGLLQPAPDVDEEIQRFANETYGRGTEYLGIHLRYREGQCMNEIQSDLQTTFNISTALMAEMQEQCTINFKYTERVLRNALGSHAMDARSDPNRFCCPAFFASDHQNRTAELDFLNRGAVLYKGRYHTKELGGLKGLSADYFLLRRSHTFIGNSASSVSQDVCFGRLIHVPWRRACAGWHLPFFRDFAHTAIADLVPAEMRY
eukprot:TRINITY_DN11307_c0_g1_i1.p1 TRINITY_DN11307_c0_g1~~TRINITY_DN11307_c0_g1_i1.p1  ORF type:complete len:522 (+),score=168.38 TRINITY_DN11307_c0_g1_i1:90-1568(+)